MVFDTLLNPVLNPLLPLGPFWTIIIISLVVSLFTTIIYKYATDQKMLRKLKADLKRYQKKASAAQKENPEKAMKLQKEMMKLNGKYMKSSFKSTLYTFIPVLIFFGWLGANLAFAPIVPGEPFSLTVVVEPGVNGTVVLDLPPELSAPQQVKQISNGSVTWTNITGPKGVHELSIMHNGTGEQHYFSVKISPYEYSDPSIEISESEIFSSIKINLQKLFVFENIFLFKDLPWIKTWGWLGSYILFSILFSTVLRKLLKLA